MDPCTMETGAALRALLKSDEINQIQLRTLCREPGIVDGSGQRARVWSILLLGRDITEDDDDVELGTPEQRCDEHQVLLADARRTKGINPEKRKSFEDVLHHYCLMHNISYKQGLNEVLVPFFVCFLSGSLSSRPYLLLEAFVTRYMTRYYLYEDSLFLFKSFRFFHLLLLYHDPQLAIHLHACDFPPELYASPWFLTNYARALPIHQVLRLWDYFLAVDDPAFLFFIGLVLVRKKRAQLLLADATGIPELLIDLGIRREEEIDEWCREAIGLFEQTPRSLLRNLRLCCCSTSELAQPSSVLKSPIPTASGAAGGAFLREDYDMAAQSVRACVVLSPREVVSLLSGPVGDRQSVVIDLRSSREACVTGGGGLLNKCIRVEPEFLDSVEFEVWLQHLDSVRGHMVTLIDIPPPNKANTSTALWKRLLFGEGDGRSKEDAREANFTWSQRDRSSPFSDTEASASIDDGDRPSVRLARALQCASFPYVSIVDGGYPSIVEHLLATRGTVDGYIDNFQRDKWIRFLRSSGRLSTLGSIHERKTDSDFFSDEFGSPFSVTAGEEQIHERLRELTESARLAISQKVASRMGHKHMLTILKKRMERLSGVEGTNLLIQSVVD